MMGVFVVVFRYGSYVVLVLVPKELRVIGVPVRLFTDCVFNV